MTSTTQKNKHTKPGKAQSTSQGQSTQGRSTQGRSTQGRSTQGRSTAIEQCVQNELRRYFDMLDGEEPGNLYRMVVRQAEQAVVSTVMEECRGNQTRASEWLGISRGNLRSKIASMDK